jgi:transcription antitermination factor NusG
MTGNLSKVYRALYDGKIQIGTVIGYDDANPLHAEMQACTTGIWYIIEAYPGHERIASMHLAQRRFGIYVPEISGTEIRRGRKVDFVRPMFPGYIFAFIWGVKAHIGRIETCPGVWRLMKIGDDYATLPDAAIDRIREVENTYRPVVIPLDAFQEFAAKRKNRRWRRAPRQEHRISDNEIVGVRSWSAFTDGLASAVDGAERNSVLRKAFGLPS